MNTIKKITTITLMLLLASTGLLFGCRGLYSKMSLTLSVQEVELFLDSTNPPLPPTGEGEEGEEIIGSKARFVASIKDLPKSASNTLIINQTMPGIVSVSLIEKEEDKNEFLYEIVALKQGRTELIVKTIEGNKEEVIQVVVTEPISALNTSSEYKARAVVGVESFINTAQVIKFSPSTTNQKDITYSLVEEVEGVSLSSDGKILVEEKTSEYITVRATSAFNTAIYTDIIVKVLQPLNSEDVTLFLQDEMVEDIVLVTNKINQSQALYTVNLENSTELVNISISSKDTSKVDVHKMAEASFLVRSVAIGNTKLTARLEIAGYEEFWIEKEFNAFVIEHPTHVSINSVIGNLNNVEILDTYISALGAPFTLRVGSVGAYDKSIKLAVDLADREKLEIKYSDGSLVNIDADILQNGTTIYIKAIANEEGIVEGSASLRVIANATIEGDVPIYSTLNMILKQGAQDMDVQYSNLSLQVGHILQINPIAIPEGSSLGAVVIHANNVGIIGINGLTINAISVGQSRLNIISAGGINKIIEVQVYEELDDFTLQLSTPAQNYEVGQVQSALTPLGRSTLNTATIAIGSGHNLQTARYPSNSTLTNISYSSSNNNVATISASGYIIAKGIGTTVIGAEYTYLENIGAGLSSARVMTRTFVLNVYMPIVGVSLNHYQYELLDKNALGYYDEHRSKVQLEMQVNPVNASFNNLNTTWSSNSPYLTVSQNGLVQASLPPEIHFATGVITATIQEYSRYYTQRSVITIRKATRVQGVSVLNIDFQKATHLYFDARLGLDSPTTNSFKLQTQIYPTNAHNQNVVYRYIQQAGDTNPNQVVSILPDGTVVPKRPGNAQIHVIAQDSYFDIMNYSTYIVLNVRVADGLSEETAIEISSASDFFAINTIQGLKLYYVLAQTIDLSGHTFTPIGIINNFPYSFTGSFNGRYSFLGKVIQNQIIGTSFNVSSPTPSNYIGLFASLENNGTIKNLNYTINLLKINLTNNATGSMAYIGGLVAQNLSGTITNVNVQIVQSDIEVASQTTHIGGVVGVNSSVVAFSKVRGSLSVKQRAGLVNHPLIYVGGIIGSNLANGELYDTFDAKNPEFINSFADLNSSLNITAVQMQNINSAVGGLVGNNQNIVRNILANANVNAFNNVGGAIGRNIGTINSVLSTSFVKGKEAVGGLVGYNTGTIENAIVLILDYFNEDAAAPAQVQGINLVGGLVGLSQNGTISFSYARSFYSRVIDINIDIYKGDIGIDLSESYGQPLYIGGLIGRVNNTNITYSYAHLNIYVKDLSILKNTTIYAGGLIGGNTSGSGVTLQNSYAKGNIIAQGQSYAGGIAGAIYGDSSLISHVYTTVNLNGAVNQGIAAYSQENLATSLDSALYLDTIAPGSTYGTSRTLQELQTQSTYLDRAFKFINQTGYWNIEEEYNQNTAFIMYDEQNKMLLQPPTSLEVVVNNGITTNPNILPDIKNNHFKLDNKTAVVYYYSNASLELNTYYLDNILTKNFQPQKAIKLVGFTSSNPNIIETTVDGLIRVKREGSVTIKVYSLLDKNVFDEFEIAAIRPITNLTLYEEDVDSKNFRELEVRSGSNMTTLKKTDTMRIYPQALTIIDGIEYLINPNIYLQYSTSNRHAITLNDSEWQNSAGIYYTDINIAKAQVIIAKEANQNLTINMVPKIDISFESGTKTLSLNFLSKVFNLRVVEGSTSLTLNTYSANISLIDIFTIDINLITDLPEESVLAVKSVKRSNEDAQSELKIISGLITKDQNKINQTFDIEVVDKFKDIYTTEQTYIITFASYDKSEDGLPKVGEPEALEVVLVLKIIPQDVIRIDMAYYAASEIFENEEGVFYNPNELPTNSITAGRAGILKMGIYPEFANADYIELTYSNPSQITLSMDQVALTKLREETEGEGPIFGYRSVFPPSELIAGGIRLRALSNYEKIEGVDTYSYNGNIYVRLLIGSNVLANTEFRLLATPYKLMPDGTRLAGITKPLTLLATPASNVELTYQNQKADNYIAIGTKQTITVSVSKLNISSSDITWSLTNSNLSPDSKLTLKRSYQDALSPHITHYEYELILAANDYTDLARFKDDIELQVVVSRIINNNLEQYISNTIKLTPTLFTITGLDVKEVINNYYTAAYGGVYPLMVHILANYDASTQNPFLSQIKGQISALERQFSQIIGGSQSNKSTWYKREGSIIGLESFLTKEDNSYPNYLIRESEVAGGENLIFIQPKRVSKNDVLVAKIKYYYDKDSVGYTGIPIIESENLSNIPIGRDNNDRFVREKVFFTDFYLRTSDENPIPIYDEAGLIGMHEGASYILMNDITIGEVTPWKPLSTSINSLDGNSYTITIKNIETDIVQEGVVTSQRNIGLFSTLQAVSTLRNVQVDLSDITLDLQGVAQVNFGGLAGVNNGGTIYNSMTTNTKKTGFNGVRLITNITINNTPVLVYAGGLVGQNAGTIVNSRSELHITASKGYIAGIVAYNAGIIASSYYKDGYIKNDSNIKIASAVGGFVVFNTFNGQIRHSYVEGRSSSVEANTGRLLGGGLEFSGDIGGFVYENQGSITDSYSNIKISSQGRSAGFVFNNSAGIIQNSYSMSRVSFNVAAHTPFTGTGEQGAVQNTGTIKNSYYMGGSFAGKPLEPATELPLVSWGAAANFGGFSFSQNEDNKEYGVWQMRELEYYTSVTSPYLNSANAIAVSKQELASQVIDTETNETIYNYKYVVGYALGTKENPVSIENADQFNSFIKEDATSESGYTSNLHVRIIRDFAFAGEDVPQTTHVNFVGVLDGNGMTISNIRVVSTHQTDSTDSIGMFKSITSSGSSTGIVKNINLNFAEVFANQTTSVGALAGVVNSGNIYNTNISGVGVVVQGKNLVGGLAGKVVGRSDIVNVTVSIAVNSSYRESVVSTASYEIYQEGEITLQNNGIFNTDSLISYAGGVAGVIDVTSDSHIQNLTLIDNSSIIGESVGGIAGLLGKTSTAQNLLVEVVQGQFFRATKVVGGIVGENRGSLENSIIRHGVIVQNAIDQSLKNKNFGSVYVSQNTMLFAGSGHSIGGAVGLNNGGTLDGVLAKIDVRNPNVDVAGGLVGRMIGGKVLNSQARGSLLAKEAVGGLVGAITSHEVTNFKSQLIKTNNFNYSTDTPIISSSKAHNNWLNIDFTQLIENQRIVIGGFVGVTQGNFATLSMPGKEGNSYNVSIYSPTAYTSTSNWYAINEWGYSTNALSYSQENFNKPILKTNAQSNDYLNEVNGAEGVGGTNKLAKAIKIFNIQF